MKTASYTHLLQFIPAKKRRQGNYGIQSLDEPNMVVPTPTHFSEIRQKLMAVLVTSKASKR